MYEVCARVQTPMEKCCVFLTYNHFLGGSNICTFVFKHLMHMGVWVSSC